MKIALLSYEYPPETGFGGIGTYTWYQARALVKLGHDVHVIAGATEVTPLTQSEHDGVQVYRFRSVGWLKPCLPPLAKMKFWWTKNRLENAVSMYRALKSLRRTNRYDLIEMPECGAEGLLVNNLMRARTLIRFHSPARLIMPYYDLPHGDLSLCSGLEQLGWRSVTGYSACSNFLAKEVRLKLGVRKPIQVIPNGIDIELFDKEEQVDIRRKFNLPKNRLIILFSGRMERRKGIHLCQEIVSSILERFAVSFVFAGQDLFNYMRDVLLPSLNGRKLRGSIHYVGKLDLATIRSFVRQSDVFVLPSLWENCPYSCLEAMAAGSAILSSDQGGMPELINDEENGLLARNGDPASYISGLEKLIEDRALRQRLGEAARKTILQSYTDDKIARTSIEYYRTFLNAGVSIPVYKPQELTERF